MTDLLKNSLYLPDGWRQCNPHSLGNLTAGAGTCGPDSKAPAIFLNRDLLQRLEIPFDIFPFKLMPGRLQTTIQF